MSKLTPGSRIVIVGAGIAGTAMGLLLTRQGYTVNIFENAPAILPLGAAISMHSGGVKCLNALGFKEEMTKIGGVLNRMCYRDSTTGEDLINFDMNPIYEACGTRTYPVSRAKLQSMLYNKFEQESGTTIALGHRCVDVQQVGEVVTVKFENGVEYTCDLCIGADGAHSMVRKFVCDAKPRRYCGYVNFNALVPAHPAFTPPDQWTTYVGDGKRASLMPIDEDRFYCFLDVPIPDVDVAWKWSRETLREELLTHFATFPQPVLDLINNVDITTVNRIPIHDLDPIPTAHNGRIVLVGDAKANLSPDLGSGGALALEDVVYLARQLEVCDISLENSLQRYSTVRLARCNDFLMRCRKRCDMLHNIDPEATAAFYASLRNPDEANNIIEGMKKNGFGGPLD